MKMNHRKHEYQQCQVLDCLTHLFLNGSCLERGGYDA